MSRKWAMLGGAALALLLVTSFPISAVARAGGGGHMGGGGHFGGGHIGGFGGGHFGGPRMGAPMRFAPGGRHFENRQSFHDRRFHNRRVFFAPAFAYDYGYGYGYGSGCYWLRRNALASGSPYWWSRYNGCLRGY